MVIRHVELCYIASHTVSSQCPIWSRLRRAQESKAVMWNIGDEVWSSRTQSPLISGFNDAIMTFWGKTTIMMFIHSLYKWRRNVWLSRCIHQLEQVSSRFWYNCFVSKPICSVLFTREACMARPSGGRRKLSAMTMTRRFATIFS